MSLRLHQDNNFEFNDFNGLKIEALIAIEIPENKSIVVVYIKVENHNWHRFFLDYGFAVWENLTEEIISEDDSYNYINKATEFELRNKEIAKIYCEPVSNHCQIIIELTGNEKIMLRPVNPDDLDSETEFVITKGFEKWVNKD